MNRKQRRDARNRRRAAAHQEATPAHKLSEFNFNDITITTDEGAALLSSLQEATKITLAAETSHIMRMMEYKEARKEHGDPKNVDVTNTESVIRASVTQVAIGKVKEAESKVVEAKARLETIRKDLKRLVEGGREVDETLVPFVKDVSLK